MAPRETENNAYAKNFGMTNTEHYGMLWYSSIVPWYSSIAYHNALCLSPQNVLHKHCFQFLLGPFLLP